jgi:hypothetical protein
MDLETLRKAIGSYDGFPVGLGIIGGEPTLHPQFEEMCKLLKYELNIPKGRLGLFTSGGPRFEKYRDIISKTFTWTAYNPHTEYQKKVCLHQPITVAVSDSVSSEDYMWKLIDDCWCQQRWCPSITPKGAFFCEVAAALDVILDGEGGWPIEPGWWRKDPQDFQDQVKRYCPSCGMPVPRERQIIGDERELFSPRLISLFQQHNLPRLGEKDVKVIDQKFTPEEIEKARRGWHPWDYRQDLKPEDPRMEVNP